jgi:polyisoprenoid-binding protein YceI
MKNLVIAFLVCFISSASLAQTWSLDKLHSTLRFSVVHLMVSEQEGSFKSFTSNISSAKDDFSDAVIDLTADVNSIFTDNEGRDEHLKKPDYFDAAKYNTLTFKSKSFTKVEGKKYILVGDLTIKGITKTVELDVTYNGTITHPKNSKKISGFKIVGVIKRSDFGIGPLNSSTLGDEVTLIANTEFIKN